MKSEKKTLFFGSVRKHLGSIVLRRAVRQVQPDLDPGGTSHCREEEWGLEPGDLAVISCVTLATLLLKSLNLNSGDN